MRYRPLSLILLLLGVACGDARPDAAAPLPERTRHVLLLANTDRADSLANLIRRRLREQSLPARLSDLSRPGESPAAIYARLPWALQQGADVFILDLPVTGAGADTLRTAIGDRILLANPAIRLLTADSLLGGARLLD